MNWSRVGVCMMGVSCRCGVPVPPGIATCRVPLTSTTWRKLADFAAATKFSSPPSLAFMWSFQIREGDELVSVYDNREVKCRKLSLTVSSQLV